MKMIPVWRALLVFGPPVVSACSAIFVEPVEVTRIDHFFNATVDPEFPNYGGDSLRFNAASFTADLDTDTEIAYTFRAPEGYKFRLGPSAGYFHLDMTFGSSVSGGGSPANIRMSLENASGPHPGFGTATLVFIRTKSGPSAARSAPRMSQFDSAAPRRSSEARWNLPG